MQRLGVTSLFVAHWVDNALRRRRARGRDQGHLHQRLQPARDRPLLRDRAVPDPSQGEEVETLGPGRDADPAAVLPGRRRNLVRCPTTRPAGNATRKGLTEARRLPGPPDDRPRDADRGRPHERARPRPGARDRRPPRLPPGLGHTGTGGSWTAAELRRLYRLGGSPRRLPTRRRSWRRSCSRFRRYRDRGNFFGVALGTDTGGFSTLPGPRSDAAANPLAYPFRSYDGEVSSPVSAPATASST